MASAAEKHALFTDTITQLMLMADTSLPEGQAKAMVHVKLEEACMWATKAIVEE